MNKPQYKEVPPNVSAAVSMCLGALGLCQLPNGMCLVAAMIVMQEVGAQTWLATKEEEGEAAADAALADLIATIKSVVPAWVDNYENHVRAALAMREADAMGPTQGEA